MRIRVSIDDGVAEGGESGHVTTTDFSSALGENGTLEPYVGMEFESEDAAKGFYVEYARQVGFNTKICQIGNFRPHDAVTCQLFVCAKEGSKKKFSDPCKAMLKIELKGNKWVITKFVKDHNHALEKPTNKLQIIQPRKNFGGGTKNVVETNQTTAIPNGVMYLSVDGNHECHASIDGNHHSRSGRSAIQKRIDGKDSQNMLEYFKKMQAENPGFFYAIQLDEDNRMANVFWADARSRTAYSHFGDVVTLDTSFRTKQYKVPFAPFTGVNHHGQTILFGCSLLQDDSEASFLWLFKTFLTAMNNRPPISIVTNQDGAIKGAVDQVLPKARHCVSKWDVLRDGQERLAHVYVAYPNFQVELYSCINLTETIQEFESCWVSIIDKYDLKRDCWLQSLYNTRKEWAPVYFRDSFFAALSPNQGFDSSFFDGYVNQQTSLPVFFRQYERAMEYWFEKEIEADFDTVSNSPVLRTPSPMEKQAANLYTRKIFEKFQDELVETFVYTANKIDSDGSITTYRVAKFEDDHMTYTVTLNVSDMSARCSCQMFEYSGILCRHVLTVFTVTNVLILPSHYILRRWTRNAKSRYEFSDECDRDDTHESIASRYNSLCLEAFRYAEEGAIDSETYVAAVNALREGEKRISIMKKNVAKVTTPQRSQEASSGYDDGKTCTSDTPLLWPIHDEVARCFNLNDSALLPKPIGGCNLLSMPTQDDNGSSGSMVVLPCLKSMTWVMENRNSTPANRVAVINLKLQDYSKSSVVESEVKFQLSMITLEPMLRSMAHISEQLFSPPNRVAVVNLKLQDTETTSGESVVKFQVSRDTLGAMLRSMAYIREQLSVVVVTQPEPPYKKHKK